MVINFKIIKIFFIAFLLSACNTRQQSKQWNLNQSIGWKGKDSDDYTVLFIRFNQKVTDSNQIKKKKKMDETILNELKLKQLGNQVENDDQTDTDLHFIVSKDYNKALKVINAIVKSYNLEKDVTVYQRKYLSAEKWTDIILH